MIATLPAEPDRLGWTIAVSPDGRLVAVADESGRQNAEDARVRIWDVERRQVVRTLRAYASNVAFTPDRTRLATAEPGRVRVWDVRRGTVVTTMAGSLSNALGVSFSADGRRLATTEFDGTVRVWDASSGEQQAVLQGHEAAATNAVFSDDGNRLASASQDGTVRVWALDLDDLVRMAERRVTRGLTDDECREFLHVDRCQG